MKHKSYLSLALTIVYVLFSVVANAGSGSEKDFAGQHKNANTEKHSDPSAAGKHGPAQDDAHSKAPHGKTHAPHSEELPHIHKFHKERVKKIKKHHSKYWLLSQALLFLCHASVLYISYLHVVH